MVRAAHERSNFFYAGILVWLLICAWCVRQGLDILAVVGSALLALWVFGLRDKFDSESSPSAYSVFNKGGQAIMGGFTGEQLDAQLRGGGSHGQTFLDSNKKKSDKDDSPLVTTATSQKPVRINENEKGKRRSAAAAAAEHRLRRQHEEWKNVNAHLCGKIKKTKIDAPRMKRHNRW